MNNLNLPLRAEPSKAYDSYWLIDANDEVLAIGLKKKTADLIVEMSRDKERLDWLEKNEVGLGWPQPTQLPDDKFFWIFGDGGPETDFHGPTLRQAIDKAALAAGGEKP